ncbi:MAG TPA: hypothetical protein VLV83_25080 [Acidobacteriota bacterium]|nr:hypothetical protein [Acidobacteriota bacterium]
MSARFKLHAAGSAKPLKQVALPVKAALALEQFLVDCKSGNVQLNIRDGQILGITVEQKLSV